MVGTFYRSAGAALALALGTTALTAPALAQERDWGEHRGGGDRDGDRGRGGNRGGNAPGVTSRSDAPRPDRPAQDRPPQDRPAWNGGEGRPNWSRPAPQPAQPPQVAAPQQVAPGYQSYSDPRRDRSYGADRNRAAPQQGWDGQRWTGQAWNNRAEPARRDDGPRPTWQRDRDGNRNWSSERGWDRDRGDPRRGSWSAGRTGGWDPDWRRDNRYDWQGWRNSHRDVYRLGRYNPPYRSYGYRRLSIGFFLDGGFFGSNYWIGDPWQYRLPPAYGPYRWVRYYDDALLVDTYTGEVVDVIYDVFW